MSRQSSLAYAGYVESGCVQFRQSSRVESRLVTMVVSRQSGRIERRWLRLVHRVMSSALRQSSWVMSRIRRFQVVASSQSSLCRFSNVVARTFRSSWQSRCFKSSAVRLVTLSLVRAVMFRNVERAMYGRCKLWQSRQVGVWSLRSVESCKVRAV